MLIARHGRSASGPRTKVPLSRNLTQADLMCDELYVCLDYKASCRRGELTRRDVISRGQYLN